VLDGGRAAGQTVLKPTSFSKVSSTVSNPNVRRCMENRKEVEIMS
jgi:hypothetical protein